MAASASSEGRSYLGKYEVVKRIATGGMGAVYQAIDTDSGREVALKVLNPELAARPVMRERLRREASHGAKLEHENIVCVFESGETAGTHYLAMEYVAGTDLHAYLERNGPLSPEGARLVLTQMVRALEHIHKLGMVHRDIKPSNILLTKKDGRTLAKLADLGLSREMSNEEYRLTREGTSLGTVDYLAPEQARDSGLADIRSDIYSLGCTFYQMLTGNPPFPDGNLTERLLKHAQVEPPDVRNFDPKIPSAMAAICKRMLAKKPADRYTSPADLLFELEELGGDDTLSDGPPRKRNGRTAAPKTPEETPASAVPPAPKAGKLDGQVELARKALSAGDRRYGMRLLFDCCRAEPSNVACREALREAAAAAPQSSWTDRIRARVHHAIVRIAKAMKRHDLVLYHGEKLLVYQPKDVKTHLNLAEAAVGLKYVPLARWLLHRAQEVHGDHPLVHRAFGLFWQRQGDMKRAMQAWEQVEKACPGDPEARFHLKNLSANATLVKGRFQERLDEPTSSEV